MKITPILGRPFCYYVESRSRPGRDHLINWLEESCTCEQWAFNQRAHRERTGKPFFCDHMIGCRDSQWLEILESCRESELTK